MITLFLLVSVPIAALGVTRSFWSLPASLAGMILIRASLRYVARRIHFATIRNRLREQGLIVADATEPPYFSLDNAGEYRWHDLNFYNVTATSDTSVEHKSVWVYSMAFGLLVRRVDINGRFQTISHIPATAKTSDP